MATQPLIPPSGNRSNRRRYRKFLVANDNKTRHGVVANGDERTLQLHQSGPRESLGTPGAASARAAWQPFPMPTSM